MVLVSSVKPYKFTVDAFATRLGIIVDIAALALVSRLWADI